MADFLDEKKAEIAARLKELAPLVKEYKKLEALMAVLDEPDEASETPPAAAPPAPAKPPKRKKPPKKNNKGGTRGRPKGSGTRGPEALALITEAGDEGISIPELAVKMGIKQNYLYRVLPGLVDDGSVEKRGTKWFLKKSA